MKYGMTKNAKVPREVGTKMVRLYGSWVETDENSVHHGDTLLNKAVAVDDAGCVIARQVITDNGWWDWHWEFSRREEEAVLDGLELIREEPTDAFGRRMSIIKCSPSSGQVPNEPCSGYVPLNLIEHIALQRRAERRARELGGVARIPYGVRLRGGMTLEVRTGGWDDDELVGTITL